MVLFSCHKTRAQHKLKDTFSLTLFLRRAMVGTSHRHSWGAPMRLLLLSSLSYGVQCGEISIEKKDCDAHAKAPEVCVLPKEKSLCRVGFIESCTSAVCYDSGAVCRSLAPEELGFLGVCMASEALAMYSNCECLFCTGAESNRLGATECYGDDNGIDVAEPVRGNCEAGGCCEPELPLCELERYFFFMSLAYGVEQRGNSDCSSSLDYFGPSHDCTVLTDGRSNDAIVCSNAQVTEDARNNRKYCDIAFSGTNDAVDVLRELFHLLAPTRGRTVTFGSGENEVSATALEMLVKIALGTDEDPMDGIMEIAYQAAMDKGCFTRDGAAVHLMAHSLGASVANFFVLKLAAEYPDVFVKMTTSGEPSVLIEPLQGKAATNKAWSNKERYINGRVLPRGQIFNDFLLPREYGLYQDYCWVSQSMPGGFPMQNDETDIYFLCEVKREDNIEHFIAGREGCAANRDDVLNEMPNFPHKGAIEFFPNDRVAQRILDELKERLENRGLDGLSDVVDFFNVILTVADENYRDAFFQILELHFIRRSMHTLNRVSQNGEFCEVVGVSNKLPDPVRKPCSGSPFFFCFSEDMTVEEKTKGIIKMRDLEIGDMVKNADGAFDRVYSFGHYAPDVQGEYIQLNLSGLQGSIEVSQEHMIFVEGSAVPASTVSIGQNIDLAGAGTARVLEKQLKTAVGAYAPFTTSGTIAVNGVAASSYISLQKGSPVLVVGGHQTKLSMQLLSHMFKSYHRLACMFYPGVCKTETYNEEGISTWVSGPYGFAKWMLEQKPFVFVAILSPLFVMGLFLYFIELVVVSRLLSLAVTGVCVVLIAMAVSSRGQKRRRENNKQK